MANILIAGQKHLSIPNMPRNSKHTIIRPKPFPSGRYPLEKIWRPLRSFSYCKPTWNKYDVVHAFNSIQYTNKPWLVTFEDHLFLYINPQNKFEAATYNFLNNRLTLENCKKLIAISDYAKMRFIKRMEVSNILDKIVNKVDVISPHFPVKVSQPKTYNSENKIQLTFVGNHFARKGGVVALRLAKKAEKMGLPITIHIISELRYGLGIPTDFPEKNKYAEDLKLLDLSNVIFHNKISNDKVLELLSESHFQVLATLHDTYGYSILEGFSVATPAITTNICALPEFIRHQENGYLLHLETNELRHWKDWQHGEKLKTEEYWNVLNSTYENLADQALQLIVEFLDRPDKCEHYEFLSAKALAQAENVHNSQKQNELFDSLYAELAEEY